MATRDKNIVLITGASAGIGYATAELFVEKGWQVYAAARRSGPMKALQDKGAHLLAMDVRKKEDIDKAYAAMGATPDVVVNNAGYGMYAPVELTSDEQMRDVFDTNFFGLAHVAQRAIPGMRARKSGRIINVTSVGGKMYTLFGAWYHATKHAVEGWSDSLRLELQDHGIQVIIVQPGAIKTEFGDVMGKPMSDSCKGTVYEQDAGFIRQTVDGVYRQKASPPSVVARTIYRAATTARPKTRYRSGKFANMLIFMRWLLSDSRFDRLVMGRAKAFRKQAAK